MDAFDDAFGRVILKEGGYSNDPRDSGGATNYGITEQVARANGYTGPMEQLPRDFAERIYRTQYWRALRLDAISERMPRLAEELFDSAVNCGVARAAFWLQRALNSLNMRGAIYSDIACDGQIGNVTLGALEALRARRGGEAEIALCRLCDAQQAEHYLHLCETRQKDEAFMFGWVMTRVGGGR